MKKFKEKYRKNISFICSFLLSCGLCFVFAFSSSQTTQVSTVTTQPFGLFCISTAKSQLESEAISLSYDSMKNGNGGYVWQIGSYFYVISSAYENKNDATLVSTALSNNNISNEVIEIKFNDPNLSQFNISTIEEKNTINNTLKFFTNCYKELFDISICLDTKLYDEKKAMQEINNIHSKQIDITKKYINLFDKSEIALYQFIKVSLQTAIQTLDDLTHSKKVVEKQTLLSQIRYTYIKICAIYYDFLKDID